MSALLSKISFKGGATDEEAAKNSPYAVISKSLKEAVKHLDGWTTGDLTFGIYQLSKVHAAEGIKDNIAGSDATKDAESIKELLHYLEYAEGAYEKDVASLCKMSMMKEKDVAKYVPQSDNLRPAYWIGVDHGKKQVIMCVRGTASIADCLTDLSQTTHPIMGGEAPLGMYHAAQWFVDNEFDTLAKLCKENPDYGLMCTGHSLGAGTATLLCLLIRSTPQLAAQIPPAKVRAIGYATPANMSLALARNSSDFITTVVCQDDLVPRGSLANVMEVRTEILGTNWHEKLTDDVMKDKYGKMAMDSGAYVAGGYSAAKKSMGAAASATSAAASDAAARMAQNKGVVAAATAGMKLMSMAKSTKKLAGGAGDVAAPAPAPGAGAGAGAAESATAHGGEEAPVAVAEDETPPTRMYAPGKLYHIRRNEDASHFLVLGDKPSRFERLILSPTMASDHLCTQYRVGLRDILKG